LYADLDLVVTIDPPSANPAPQSPDPDEPKVLSTWPEQPGDYAPGGAFTPGSPMFWEAHGLALPPRLTNTLIPAYQGIVSVQALRADEYFGPLPSPVQAYPYQYYSAHENPGLFQLAPDTRLMPLKTVVLYVPGDEIWGQGWLPKRMLQAAFDDYWTGTKTIGEVGLGLWATQGEWQTGCDDCASAFIQPDRVWDQCGIQFRVVKYHECPVSADVFWYNIAGLGIPSSQACDLYKMHETVKTALAECPGFDFEDGLRPILFKGNLVYENRLCQFGGNPIKVPGWTALADHWAYIRQYGGGLLIAHEIGHLLGLPDNNPCGEPHTLMCSTDPQHDLCAPSDTGQDACAACGTPRTVAKNQQDAYWGP
jgi:hypothetical protein